MVGSDKLELIDYDTDGICGKATYSSGYPWSYIVEDRAEKLTVAEKIEALCVGNPILCKTERHENMHQFENFLDDAFGWYSEERWFMRRAYEEARLRKLQELKAPEIVLQDVRHKLDALTTNLPKLPQGKSFEDQLQEEIFDDVCDEVKSEFLAFLWSVNVTDLFERLYGYALCNIEYRAETYRIDLSRVVEKARVIIQETVLKLYDQMLRLESMGETREGGNLVQLAAMMNIDRPLAEWGMDA